jgi:carbon monoxide dehydrogenase subunit G
LLDEAATLLATVRDPILLGWSLAIRGVAERDRGDDARAIECFERALESWRDGGNRSGRAIIFTELAEIHLRTGRAGEAARLLAAALDDWQAVGCRWGEERANALLRRIAEGGALGEPMHVEHSIHIDAPPEVVWRVTEDVERWPEWTPTVTSVQRVGSEPFGLGSVARIKQPAQPEAEWVITEFENRRRFAWETRRTGLHMAAIHDLAAEGTGTRNLLRVEASGAVAVLLWPILRYALRRALADENQGLKKRAEQMAMS